MNNRSKLQGYLNLSGSEKIINMSDTSFGVDYRVVDGAQCLLFSSLPQDANVNDAGGSLQSISLNGSYPAIFIDSMNQVASVLDEVKPGQHMLARQLALYPELMEVVIYEPVLSKDPTMPETGDQINILQKGYVSADKVQPLGKASGVFKPMTGSIFPNNDLFHDIKQYRFGDCFLLASLQGILAKPNGENFIRSMMIQDGQSTIVRLYDPETYEPRYIRVQNTSYHVGDENYNRHGAPWVHIVEKAYTAFAHNSEKKHTYPAFKELFGAGGRSDIALSILTGKPATNMTIQTTANDNPLDYLAKQSTVGFDGAIFSVGNKYIYLKEKYKDKLSDIIAAIERLPDITATERYREIQINEEDDVYIQDIAKNYNQFKEDHALTAIIHSFEEYIEFYSVLFNLFSENSKDIFHRGESFTNIGDVHAFYNELANKKVLPNKYLHLLSNYIETYQAQWINPNRKDIYTPELNKLYSDIKSAFEKNPCSVLTASSNEKFDNVPGLRNKHAYAIMGVTERETKGVNHKYIVLRNPWGRVGRKYNDELNHYGFAASTEVGDATFEVELTDFQRYFRKYAIGQMPRITKDELKLAQYEITKNRLLEKISKLDTACNQFIKDLTARQNGASTGQIAILADQISIVNSARSELKGANHFCTSSSLGHKLRAFEAIIFNKENVKKLQQSNDGAGARFLKIIAAILTIGLLYNRFFGNTHQKTFIREVSKERDSTPHPIRN